MTRFHAAAYLLVAWLLSPAAVGRSDVQLDPLFSDGIVLQQDVPVAIYGSASPGEQVTVEFDGQQKAATAAADGSWLVHLDPLAASGRAFTLTVSAASVISVQDVLVGEVWLCAGQSNMLKGIIFPDELASEPNVRWRRVAGFFVEGPGEVCWRFAVALHEALGVPVMIINNARGGSKIRQWLSPRTVPDPVDPVVDAIVASYAEWGKWYPDVELVQPFTVRGIAWWQGESDRRSPLDHQHLLPALIRSWRADWGQGDIPFVIMQLPSGKGMAADSPLRRLPRKANRGHRAADLRQAFFLAQRELPAVSMVINGDLRGGTHPPKTARPEYARRITNAALANVYGAPVAWSGPVFESMTREGNALRLSFKASTATGLKSIGGDLQGFALSADGERWEWADAATVEGELVVVSSSQVPSPSHVRYGWGKRSSFANLFNEADLPASPFAAELE